MGISISIFDGEVPRFPFEIKVILECDDRSEMFCRGWEGLQSSEGFIGCYSTFMDMGWLERHDAGGRKFICPACSGKPVLTNRS